MTFQFSSRAARALTVTLSALGTVACSSQNAPSASPTAPSTLRPALSARATDKAGCPGWGNPGGNSGVNFIGLMSPEEAVALSVAQITDAWYAQQGLDKDTFIAERLAGVTAQDKNGDGLLCIAQNWGANLNPNSHWAVIWADTLSPPATERWLFADNHNGTST